MYNKYNYKRVLLAVAQNRSLHVVHKAYFWKVIISHRWERAGLEDKHQDDEEE